MSIIKKDKSNVICICHCDLCEYDWDSIKERPKACPRCHRYDWDNNYKEVPIK